MPSGAVGNVSTASQIGGVKSIVNTASGITAIITSANPAGAALVGAGTVVNLFSKLNHPYGTCAPTAPSSSAFLSCWKHAALPDLIPYWKGDPTSRQPGTKGWDFAVCRGASGSRPPSGGCPGGCDCSSKPCVCAPQGAVEGLRDGTFVDAGGNNLGPAVLNTSVDVITVKPSNPLSPLQPIQTGQLGTMIGDTGTIVPYSQISQNRIPMQYGPSERQAEPTRSPDSSTGIQTGLIVMVVIAVGLVLVMSQFARGRR